jgi:hypothetical protein
MGVSDGDRKARVREYKEQPPEAGIYRVLNTSAGTALVGSTPNLPGMLNRQHFQLEMGSHPDRELQDDWNALGADAFTFEVLDRLEAEGGSAEELAEDLAVLKDLWLERLRAAGNALYRWSERG